MLKDTIKKYRVDKRLTQEELAEKIHVSRSLIAKWEQGRGVPSVEDFEALCSALDIKIEDIVPYSTVVEQSKSNKKKKNVIISLVAIILVLVIVWIVVDNVDRTYFKRDLYIGDIYLGEWQFESQPINYSDYVSSYPVSVHGKNVGKIEEAILNNKYYQGKITYKQNLLNEWYGDDEMFIGKECYVLAKGRTTFLLRREGDSIYIKDFQSDIAYLYGEVIPDKYDAYGDECHYIAGITDNIIKTNKKKYYCGVEYEPAYTINEMHMLYETSVIDESGKCLIINNAMVIGFVNYRYNIRVHFLENGNITFELVVGQ